MISHRAKSPAEPHPAWSLADDYLCDPAVAPMRALLAALVRRVNRSRRKAPPHGRPPADRDARIHTPA